MLAPDLGFAHHIRLHWVSALMSARRPSSLAWSPLHIPQHQHGASMALAADWHRLTQVQAPIEVQCKTGGSMDNVRVRRKALTSKLRASLSRQMSDNNQEVVTEVLPTDMQLRCTVERQHPYVTVMSSSSAHASSEGHHNPPEEQADTPPSRASRVTGREPGWMRARLLKTVFAKAVYSLLNLRGCQRAVATWQVTDWDCL